MHLSYSRQWCDIGYMRVEYSALILKVLVKCDYRNKTNNRIFIDMWLALQHSFLDFARNY